MVLLSTEKADGASCYFGSLLVESDNGGTATFLLKVSRTRLWLLTVAFYDKKHVTVRCILYNLEKSCTGDIVTARAARVYYDKNHLTVT